MKKEEMDEAFEKLLVPIRELYSEITTKGTPFCYPLIYNDIDEDFLGYIVPLIKKYVARVKKMDEKGIFVLNHAFDKLPSSCKPQKSFDFLRDLEAVSDMVVEVLTDSYRCYPDDAFQKLKKFFEDDDNFYLYMLPQLKVSRSCFYRIRTGTFDHSNDGKLFHIPFEKRHLVSSQRYSIPGYPILYLAGSLFTAWCEMDKPELAGMSFAGFKFKDNAVFLDLGYPFKGETLWQWYSLFVMYPLLMACMVRVKHPSAPFKPEYIMPQLMTKLVREHGCLFKGIAYMSNKLPDVSPIESLSSRNFAVCTYNCICSKGYDKDLAAEMEMTDIKTITNDDIRKSVSVINGKYSVDFHMLENRDEQSFRDINVSMVLG